MIRWSLLFGIAFGVVLLDQVTKALVIANLSLYERWMPIDALSRVFSITLHGIRVPRLEFFNREAYFS